MQSFCYTLNLISESPQTRRWIVLFRTAHTGYFNTTFMRSTWSFHSEEVNSFHGVVHVKLTLAFLMSINILSSPLRVNLCIHNANHRSIKRIKKAWEFDVYPSNTSFVTCYCSITKTTIIYCSKLEDIKFCTFLYNFYWRLTSRCVHH